MANEVNWPLTLLPLLSREFESLLFSEVEMSTGDEELPFSWCPPDGDCMDWDATVVELALWLVWCLTFN